MDLVLDLFLLDVVLLNLCSNLNFLLDVVNFSIDMFDFFFGLLDYLLGNSLDVLAVASLSLNNDNGWLYVSLACLFENLNLLNVNLNDGNVKLVLLDDNLVYLVSVGLDGLFENDDLGWSTALIGAGIELDDGLVLVEDNVMCFDCGVNDLGLNLVDLDFILPLGDLCVSAAAWGLDLVDSDGDDLSSLVASEDSVVEDFYLLSQLNLLVDGYSLLELDHDSLALY